MTNNWHIVLLSMACFVAAFSLLQIYGDGDTSTRGSSDVSSVIIFNKPLPTAPSVHPDCITYARNWVIAMQQKNWTTFDASIDSFITTQCGLPILYDTCGNMRLQIRVAKLSKDSAREKELNTLFGQASCNDASKKTSFCGVLKTRIEKPANTTDVPTAKRQFDTYCTCSALDGQMQQIIKNTNEEKKANAQHLLMDMMIDMACTETIIPYSVPKNVLQTGSAASGSGSSVVASQTSSSSSSGATIVKVTSDPALCKKTGDTLLRFAADRKWDDFVTTAATYEVKGCGPVTFADSCAAVRLQMIGVPATNTGVLLPLQKQLEQRGCLQAGTGATKCGDYRILKNILEKKKSSLRQSYLMPNNAAVTAVEKEIAELAAKYSEHCTCANLQSEATALAQTAKTLKRPDPILQENQRRVQDEMIAMQCTYQLLLEPPKTLKCGPQQHAVKSCTTAHPASCEWTCTDLITRQMLNKTCGESGKVYKYCNTYYYPPVCRQMCVRQSTRKEADSASYLCPAATTVPKTACTITLPSICNVECFPST